MTKINEHEILFVTSFGPDMWEATGRRMVAEFYKNQPHGSLMVCYERFDYQPHGDREILVNLDNDDFLQTWLKENEEHIPHYLGGVTTQCGCKNSHEMHCKNHVKGCYWSWPNRNASRWFRKVACHNIAAKMPWRFVCWIDSDAWIKNAIELPFFMDHLHGFGFFYFRAHRPAPETGIIGFDMEYGGRQFVDYLCHRYTSGEYLQYERWDDGFIVGTLVDEKLVGGVDVCRGMKINHNDVIPHTEWGKFVVHEKGAHGRRLLESGKEPVMR